MKKTISISKHIEFPTMIGEITAISLEENLKFFDQSNIDGELIISGKYKMTEASIIEEDFKYKVPVEILLTERLDLNTTKIEVDDFYYEIENEDTLKCYVDIKIEGIEELDESETFEEEQKNTEIINNHETTPLVRNEISEETEYITPNIMEHYKDNQIRECDGDKNIETIHVENEISTSNKINEGVGSLFSSFKDSDETFSTYSVYILRQDETIETVTEKYKITREELEKYNDLTNLSNGIKLIIPNSNE